MDTNEINEHHRLLELQEINQEEERLIQEYKREHCSGKKSPLEDAGWFSRLMFNWMFPKFEVSLNHLLKVAFLPFLLIFLAWLKNNLPARVPLQTPSNG